MAIIKCKMCGGDLVIEPGSTVAECEYCGSRQTVPSADNEKKLTLFARANRLRLSCEFDKAAGIYESIVADFPEEAEAYWGLVLCKYGIEYVDDPGTGRKIPTCHRSSYDSVLEDGDFDQACENADILAQKVYREEAKEFEWIRKQILEVSSSEKPYDIFICYKETDEKGGRTLDSVLAQDLYTALTDKGYRVFFSRVTLQGKLGEAYEPYIFAALNSARVMLAVGTCYEYYNAVWVKNEWSRYIKLCEADKSKHLIPCYRDLEPEDMPKEFNHLQGADLGKMGAVQDILFNMEKYIPLKKQAAVQEQTVAGGSKGESLLKRGNMALEDGDWDKADGFFEEVLNLDAECAEAYTGKFLAQNRQKTMESYVRWKLAATKEIQPQYLMATEPDEDREEAAVQEYAMQVYLKSQILCELYEYDLRYPAVLPVRKAQAEEEKRRFDTDKLMSRALRFARGDNKAMLEKNRKTLFDALDARIPEAKKLDDAEIQAVRKAYEDHLDKADAKAERLYREAVARAEKDYTAASRKMEAAKTAADFRNAAGAFAAAGTYRDSVTRAKQCREEAQRLELEAQNKAISAKKRKKTVKIVLIATAVLAVAAAIGIAILMKQVILPRRNYQNGEALLAAGDYEGAVNAFLAAGDYEGAAEKLKIASYRWGEALETAGDAVHAAMAFGKAGDYQDARQRSMAYWDTIAVRDTVSAGNAHTVALKNDGTVVAAGENSNGQCDVGGWTDIIAVSAGYNHTVGLKADGTVVAAGPDAAQCDVGQWTDIVSISAGTGITLGLKSDGTVVYAGKSGAQNKVGDWTDIIAVGAGTDHSVGLKADGTVVMAGTAKKEDLDVSAWRDIADIRVKDYRIVGLKSDGTVVAVFYSDTGCDVEGWTDIIAVSTGNHHTVGLKSDGTVVVTADPGTAYTNFGQFAVGDWQGIVAVIAGGSHTVGLRADGTLVSTAVTEDYMDHGQTAVGQWSDIKLPTLKIR